MQAVPSFPPHRSIWLLPVYMCDVRQENDHALTPALIYTTSIFSPYSYDSDGFFSISCPSRVGRASRRTWSFSCLSRQPAPGTEPAASKRDRDHHCIDWSY